MSQAVDSKVVEMSFDNRQFEQGVQTSMSTLDKLKQALRFDDATKGIQNVNSAVSGINMGGLGGAIESVQMKFSAMEVIAMTALSNITNSVVNTAKHIANEFTIQPVKDGFAEYELKMGSVQTIMASTGESVETVNRYLNDLNEYSDKTIYSFKDMTSNIGKFTNNGVKLEDAVNAMKGISNEAARSGATAAEASSAMYNFSQALSAGSVKLLDWRSIENANMGTTEFRQELIDTAVALGTLVKDGDNYVSTTTNMQGRVSEAFNATQRFTESLNHQWMTSEVLTQTLANYSKNVEEMTEEEKKAYHDQLYDIYKDEEKVQAIMELGVQASKAATEVKTFTQMMGSLEEAVGSGWAQTFELLFGNLDEAKKLWTGINDVLSSVIGGASEARNSLLGEWKDLGGRNMIIAAFAQAFEGLLTVVKPIKDAFREIFPPATGKQLAIISKNILNFTYRMKLSDESMNDLKNTFTGLFSIVRLLIKPFGLLAKVIFPAQTATGGLLSIILKITGTIGAAVTGIVNWVDSLGLLETVVSTIQSIVVPAFSKIKELAADVFRTISDFISANFTMPDLSQYDSVGDAFKGVWESIKPLKDNLPSIEEIGTKVKEAFGKIKESIPGKDSKIASGLGAVNDLLNKVLGDPKEIKNKATETTKSLGDGILEGLVKIDFEKVTKGVKLGALIFLVVQIGSLFRNLSKATGDFRKMTKSIAGIPDKLNKTLGSLGSTLKTYQNDLRANILLKVAAAIGILTISIIALTFVDSQKLANVAVDLALVIGVVAILAAVIGEIANKKGGGEGDPVVDMLNGFLEGIQKAVKKAISIVSKAAAFALVAAAVFILVKAIATLAGMQMSVGKALGVVIAMIAIGAYLVILTKQLNKAGKGMDAGNGVAIFAIAAAIQKLSMVAVTFSAMSGDEMKKGLGGVLALVIMFGVLGKALNKSQIDKAAGGILAISLAMLILVPVIMLFGQLSEVAMQGVVVATFLGLALEGLAAIAGLIGEKFGGKNLLKGVGAMIAISAAIYILAPALLLLGGVAKTALKGIGVMALALGALLVVAAVASIGPVTTGLTALSLTLLSMGASMLMAGAGSIMLAAGLARLIAIAAVVITAVVAIFNGVSDNLDKLPELGSKIVTGIVNIFKVIGATIVAYAPVVLEKILTLIGQLPGWIATQLPNIIAGIISLVIKIIAALGNIFVALRNVVGALLKGLITGIVKGVAGAAGPIGNAMKGLLLGFINLIVDGLSGFISKIPGGDIIVEKLQSWRDGVAETLKPEEAEEAAEDYAKGFSTGAEKGSADYSKLLSGLANDNKETAKKMASDGEAYGKEYMHQTASGVEAGSAETQGVMSDEMTKIMDAMGESAEGSDFDFSQFMQGNISDGLSDVDFSGDMTSMLNGQFGDAFGDVDLSGMTKELGMSIPEGTGDGVSENMSLVTGPVEDLGSTMEETMRNQLQINSPSKVFSEIGKGVPEGMAQGVTQGANLVQPAITRMVSQMLMSLRSLPIQFRNAGVTATRSLANGISSESSKAETAGKNVAGDAVTGARSKRESMEAAGKYVGDGLVKGIKEKGTLAKKAGEWIAAKAIKATKDKIDAASPSKVYIRFGEYMGDGLALGMYRRGDEAAKAGGALGQKAIDATKDSLKTMRNLISGEIAVDPTIRPVLDLTNIQEGARAIDSILPNSSVGLTFAAAYNAPGGSYRMTNEDVVSAINSLRDDLNKNPRSINNYTVGDVSYDDGTNVATAVRSLIRAARTERRA